MCPENLCPEKLSPDSPADQVALASRVLATTGNADMVWGHVSVRDPHGRGIWMKAAGWGLEEITPARVQLLGFDGELLEGHGPVHIEHFIHGQLYLARPDINSVVHTHAPAAVAFAALEVPLRPISHEGCLFGPADIPRFTTTGGLIAGVTLGQELAACVGAGNGALIPAHGLVAVGQDAALAVMTSIFLDRACQVQLPVEAAGGPRRWSDNAESKAKRDTVCSPTQLRAGWGYLTRRVGSWASSPLS
jgi:ribulose-5-phosphate 4-epimerase/fuculose-1-phosphate aldolase